MAETDYLLVVLGMGAVTYLPRWAPLVLLSGRDLPRWLRTWLSFVPAAVLSALLAPALFLDGSAGLGGLLRPEPLAAVPTFLFAWRFRSLGGTVLLGMAVYWILSRAM